MDEIELYQRLGLAIAIGAAVGVERHWRAKDEPEGARAAGIRTFTMIGMTGGVAGLVEKYLPSGVAGSGIAVTGFLVAMTLVVAVFELREAIASKSFSVTSVVAAMLTFGLGVVAVLGDMTLASAGGVALLAILAARQFLHQAIQHLQWVELRSAVILLAMTFVLLPVIPKEPVGPFGGVSPASLVLVAVTLASISFVGYIAVRILGSSRGDLVAGSIGGLVSSTGTTIAFARRAAEGETSRTLAAGAIAAGAVSLARTGVLVGTLAPSLLPSLLPPLAVGGVVMTVYAFVLAARAPSSDGARMPQNPFELSAVAKMALLLVVVAFLARAAATYFGAIGLILTAGLSGLADIDATTVAVAGMLPSLARETAVEAIGVAILANIAAKAVYATVLAGGGFSRHLWVASILASLAALAVSLAPSVS